MINLLNRPDLKPGGNLTVNSAYTASNDTMAYGSQLAYDMLVENVVNSGSSDTIFLNGANNKVTGYTAGRAVGNDVIWYATAPDLIFCIAIGLIVGARLGYVIFYDYNEYMTYLKNPLEIIATWDGGMSFHGGLLGSIIACWWFCRRRKLPFWAVVDSVTVTGPIGLGLGRIGNFINCELLGAVAAVMACHKTVKAP